MTESAWWASSLNSKGLSQGDVIATVPICSPQHPITYLSRDTRSIKGRVFWPESEKLEPFKTDRTGLLISRGPLIQALVISHSCELDDKPDVGKVLVAPIAVLDERVPVERRGDILAQKRRAFMPLPGIPDFGDCYADLRCICFLDRKFIPDSHRQFSMTDDALLRLQAQLIAFFTRFDPTPMAESLRRGAMQ